MNFTKFIGIEVCQCQCLCERLRAILWEHQKNLNRGWKRTDSDFAKILCMNFLWPKTEKNTV